MVLWQTIRSPAESRAVSVWLIADVPLDVAMDEVPPSSAVMRVSRASIVGLPERK